MAERRGKGAARAEAAPILSVAQADSFQAGRGEAGWLLKGQARDVGRRDCACLHIAA